CGAECGRNTLYRLAAVSRTGGELAINVNKFIIIMQHLNILMNRQKRNISRGAFTLVEIVVALAILVLMLDIIIMPLNMGVTMLHLGSAQIDIQKASQNTVNQMRNDLSRAIYVYPNDVIDTVTGIEPLSTTVPYPQPWESAKLPYGGYPPYFNDTP